MNSENKIENLRRRLAAAAKSYSESPQKNAVSFLAEIDKLTYEYYKLQHPELQE